MICGQSGKRFSDLPGLHRAIELVIGWHVRKRVTTDLLGRDLRAR